MEKLRFIFKKRVIKVTGISFFLAVVLVLFLISKGSAATSPWTQNDWSGGGGQGAWSTINQYASSDSVIASSSVQLNFNWYNASWTYRRAITINHTNVGATLTNYPLLINIASDSAMAAHALASGNDILFTSSDGVTKLDHEIEKYSSTSGSLQAWVRIPTLSSTTDTVLYLYYGNAGATNQQNATGVWDSNYVAVYHLGETNGTQHDSTTNANNTTSIQVTQQGTNIGLVDGADQFNSTLDKLTIGNNLALSPPNDMTAEIWLNATESAKTLNKNQTVLRQQHSVSPFQSWLVTNNTNDNYCLQWANTSLTVSAGCTGADVTTPNSWEYLVMEHTGSNFAAYVNATSNLGSNPTTSGTMLQGNGNLFVGSNGGGTITNFGGDIDEVRVSNIARSAGYVTTVYDNLNSPSTFETVDSEITKSGSITGTLTSSIFDTGRSSDFGTLTYSVTTPANTSASVFVRTGNTPNLSDATAFSSCNTIASGSTMALNNCVNNGNRYIQYRISLTSTDSVSTPTFSSLSLAFSQSNAPASTGFIQRSGNSLFLNGNQFRFAGADIYQLNITDHPQTITAIATQSGSSKSTLNNGNIDYSTHFEIDSALQTAKLMGATVVRTFPLTVGCLDCIEVTKGNFNDAAFDNLDYAIQQANTYGIRLIIPLSNNWWYSVPGGKHFFTDWEGDNNEADFYTNGAVITDFEAYVSHVLNHVNTYTNVTYKNEPTIAWWATGNELYTAIPTWTQTIAAYIKSIDSNHLVEDGASGSPESGQHLTTTQLSQESSVDIYADHSYPDKYSWMQTDADQASNYNKAFYIGEYDWTEKNGGDSLATFLSNIEGNSEIAGDLFWSLWPQNNTYGFESGDQYTFNYFGDSSDTATRAAALRNHAYAMQGISVPSYPTPGAPNLYNISDAASGVNLWWRGDPNAASYTVERSADGGSTWAVLQTGLTDSSTPYNDTSANANVHYSYRVKALNKDGVAGAYSTIQNWPVNIIQNGSFENSSAANSFAFWLKSSQNSPTVTYALDSSTSEDGNDSAKIAVTNVGSPAQSFNVQFMQKNINLTNGVTYNLTFWAKADSSRNIQAVLQQKVSPFTLYFNSNNVALTTSWQKFSYTFKATNTDSATNLVFNVSQTTGSVWLDNISITPMHVYAITPVQTTNGATFSWSSTLAADSAIDYGLTSSYGHTSTTTDTGDVTAHSNAITGLAPCATVHYKVKSVDTISNEMDSNDSTATGGGCDGNATVVSAATQPITDAVGGAVSLEDTNAHGMSLTIPAGTAGQDASFQLAQLDRTSAISGLGQPDGIQIVGDYIYQATALTDVSARITNFQQPMTVTLSYAESDIDSRETNTVSIYHYHNSQWTQLGNCNLNISAHTVTCTTNDFSTFALGEGIPPSQSGSSNNSSSSYSCTAQAPSSAPNLYEVDVTNTTAILFFAPAGGPYNSHYISYGDGNNSEGYGVQISTGQSSGAISYTVQQLSPNHVYTFKVRGGNGCQPGPWSNTLTIHTKAGNTRTAGVYFPTNQAQYTSTTSTSWLGQVQSYVSSIFPGVPNTGLAPAKQHIKITKPESHRKVQKNLWTQMTSFFTSFFSGL